MRNTTKQPNKAETLGGGLPAAAFRDGHVKFGLLAG